MSKKATLDTKWGEVTIAPSMFYGTDVISMDGIEVDLEMPNVKDELKPPRYQGYHNMGRLSDPEDLEAQVAIKRGNFVPDELATFMRLVEFAQYVVESYNPGNAELIEAARVRREKEDAEREQREAKMRKEREERAKAEVKAREERMAKMQERKEMLLNEFMGETGRVRARGYKSLAWPVTVDARDMGDGDFVPYFKYGNPDDYWRSSRLEDIMVFDVKVGSRYKEVWDDGEFDLPYYDRADKERNVVKYDGELLQ